MKRMIYLACSSLLLAACSAGEEKTETANDETVKVECEETKNSCDPFTESMVFLNAVTKNTSGEDVVYPEGQATITNKLAVWEPGFETDVHKHPVPGVVTVWEGELTVHLIDEDKTIVTKAGESYVSTPGLWHQSSNQGKETLKFSIVFLGNDSESNTVAKEQ